MSGEKDLSCGETTLVLHHESAPTHAPLLTHDLTEIHFERTTISDDSRDYGKFADGATRDPEKGVPGLFPEVSAALGALHQCRRGAL
jgi:hypothetical protein